MTEYDEKEEHNERGGPFFPHHVLKEGMVMLLVIGLLVLLATFLPAPMEPPADPFSTPAHIKPEWYFLFSYQFLKLAEHLNFLGAWAPKTLGVLGQILLIAALFLFPFLDKNPERHPKRRPIMMTIGIVGVVFYLVLAYWGYVS